MNEFINQLELFLTGFPPLSKRVFCSALGSLVICIVVIRQEKEPSSVLSIIGRFLAGWIAGCFITPGIEGWWFFTRSQAGSGFAGGIIGYGAIEGLQTNKQKLIKAMIDMMTKSEPPASPPAQP